MQSYIYKRLLLAFPTILGILAINFFVIQLAPGGPVEQMVANMQGTGNALMERVVGSTSDTLSHASENLEPESILRSTDGMDQDLIDEIRRYYGFDRPVGQRFLSMVKKYACFELGDSFFRDISVAELICEKMPVSISLGLWSTLLIYLISIPLGIAKAVRRGTAFDAWTSFGIVVASSIPAFLFAVLLVILFSGGAWLTLFPLRGLVSPGFENFGTWHRIVDYFWHMCLPITTLVIGGLSGLTMLTRNAFLDEMGKLYVIAARAKGLTQARILYGHVFRNAMMLVISGFPGVFIGIFFTGSMMIEIIFSLDGLGLMGFEAAMQRDYPIMFGTMYISTLMGIVLRIVSDLTYTLVDPRIDFEASVK